MATYYVGPGGNDANAGTSWGARKLTLNGAEDIPVAAGDEVVVGPGTYRESLTVDVSGGAGSAITYTGDYTGARTSGTKGIVRITGSADDIALTRASCITGSSKNYRTFRGFTMDLTSSHVISLTTCDNWTVTQCGIRIDASAAGVNMNYLSTNVTVSRCFASGGNHFVNAGTFGGTTADNCGHVVQNCVYASGYNVGSYSVGVQMDGVGGALVNNCVFMGCAYAGVRGRGLAVGQVVTVNNCIITYCQFGLNSDSTAKFTEDYNTLWSNATARSNVTAGANSVTRPPLLDTRWFFEMVNGGRLVTPFDLASYSTLVEYNSGTGAPSTDLRGASVVDTYREWGALEYDSTLSIAGGGASRVIGSPFIRGLGAV